MRARPTLALSAPVLGVLVLGAALALAACGGGGAETGSANPPPPPVLVKGGPGAFSSVVVTAGTRTASLDRAQWAEVTPLLAAKSFTPTEPLSSYGLGPPAGRMVLRARAGRVVTLVLGGPTFDNHFVYVMLPGRRSVYTVASDQLRAILARVGVVVGPAR